MTTGAARSLSRARARIAIHPYYPTHVHPAPARSLTGLCRLFSPPLRAGKGARMALPAHTGVAQGLATSLPTGWDCAPAGPMASICVAAESIRDNCVPFPTGPRQGRDAARGASTAMGLQHGRQHRRSPQTYLAALWDC